MADSYMKVNILRRILKGRGTIKSMKSAISATRSRKTWTGYQRGSSRIGTGTIAFEGSVDLQDCSRESC